MLTKSWRIVRVWKNQSDIIEMIEYEIQFTDAALPGVESGHRGIISLASLQLPSDSPRQTLVDGIIQVTGSYQMGELEGFHLDQLAFEYALQSNTMLEIEPQAPSMTDYRRAIQSCLDAKAQERNYDDGHTIATYVNSTVPAWAAEAQAFVVWRDGVWVYAFAEMAKVQAGEREAPTPEEFCAEMPAFEWAAVAA